MTHDPSQDRRSSSSTTSKPPLPNRSIQIIDPDIIAVRHEVEVIEAPAMKPEEQPESSTAPLVVSGGAEARPEGCWANLPRVTWLFAAYVLTGVISVTWLVYCCVRYTLAIEVYSDHPLRLRDAISFATLSFVALTIIVFNLVIVSLGFKLSLRSHAILQGLLLIASFAALVPASFNVAAICVFHGSPAARDPYLSLVGRCTVDSDVVWSGVSGGCAEGDEVPWGDWLAVGLVRLGVTIVFLLAFHWLTWTQVLDPNWGTPERVSLNLSAASLVPLPGPQGGKLRKRRPESIRTATAPDSASSLDINRRTFSSSIRHHGHQSAASLTYIPQHFLRASPSMTSGPSSPPPPLAGNGSSQGWTVDPEFGLIPSHVHALQTATSAGADEAYVDLNEGADLNRFAANFRSLVERVTRETEAGSVLPLHSPTSGSPTSPGYPRRSYSPPPRRHSFGSVSASSSGSLHRSNSLPPSFQQQDHHRSSSPRSGASGSGFEESEGDRLRRQLLTAHHIMLLEQADRAQSYEHIMVLGNAVRRMSTIPSLSATDPATPSSETPTFRDVGVGVGVTRSPTASSAKSASGVAGRNGRRRSTNSTNGARRSNSTPPVPTPPPEPPLGESSHGSGSNSNPE